MTDLNPYAPPSVVGEERPIVPRSFFQRWSTESTVIVLMSVLVAFGLSILQIETIIFSGPILGLVGVVMATLAWRAGQMGHMWWYLSLVIYPLAIFGLIFSNSWNPAQAYRPVNALNALFIGYLVWFGWAGLRLFRRA